MRRARLPGCGLGEHVSYVSLGLAGVYLDVLALDRLLQKHGSTHNVEGLLQGGLTERDRQRRPAVDAKRRGTFWFIDSSVKMLRRFKAWLDGSR